MQVEYLTLDDGIEVDANTINKAKNNDGAAFFAIGWKYEQTEKDYSKVMGWYRLAANQNRLGAYNNIGNLYTNGLGVSRDDDIALEYFLKGAVFNDDIALGNIGECFLDGQGVPADKYKALEFYIKCGNKPEQVKALNDEGVHLKEEDKSKLYYY
jgi:TPR repeat protein